MKDAQPDYDLLIVGGGMVGGCLALALQGSGLRIALLEAVAPTQRFKSSAGKRAIALSWGSRCLLQQLGLWDKLQADAIPIPKIHVSDQGHFGKARLDAEQQGVASLGYVVAASAIERVIYDALEDSDCELLCPATLNDFETDEGQVSVHLTIEKNTETRTTRLLVGADGADSRVRSEGGFDVEHYDYQQTAITTMLATESDDHSTAFERFTPRGPLAMLPHFDGLYSLVWTQSSDTAEHTQALSDSDFIAQLQHEFGDWLGALSLAGPRQTFPLRLSRVKQTISHRCVLIGNAAHQLHPVAGQGFNLGLRDAAQLAEVVLNHQEDPGQADCLSHYQALRGPDQSLISGFTDGVVRLFSNDLWPFNLARNSGLLLLDKWPLLKRAFAQQTMGVARRRPRLSPRNQQHDG